MRSLFLKSVLAAGLASACAMSYAVTATEAVENQPQNTFYRSGAEGWYWYQDPKPEDEPLLEEPPAPEVAKEDKAPEPPKEVQEAKVEPAPFSLKWVQEMIPKYQELAWDNPTQENVQAFFLIQRFAMDRANKFADVAQQVVVGNALLDEGMRRPLASFATTYVDRAAADKADALLKKIAQKAGIFFFFRSDCRFCEAQAPILGYLEQLGFDILAVSLDGGELQSRKFKNTKIDSGQAQALGVQATPAMFLMNEDGQFSPIGQTVLSLGELRRRILLVASREGWISDDEFKTTQPFINPADQHDLSQELPRLLKASADPSTLFGSPEQSAQVAQLSPAEKQALINKDNFIEPTKLIALFTQANKPVADGAEPEGEDADAYY
ncbi:conjugal transfer protein TraF [Sutterella sp.]|uniref:conjugal transfer protein TraF n=1 Tax=Sutterella sp. TaxID=1981025 RepID=UPI003FD75AC3